MDNAMTPRSAIKAAELASALGAIVLGIGLGLVAPSSLREIALPVLGAGILVHAAGMTLKHRMESQMRQPLYWERSLYWLCWALLGATLGWMVMRLTS
ncbi:hypothetical protein GHT07_18855 [Caenimonas koreensis DSM 17982]|uniref:Uncharacterized protein n=1 Tax=Caenimonas koreensis DSM 17982 TaxID=1121255 RepID=A0A844AXR8_9BURK|nr:hypothetical protein [Caenimonas koreensis]MRD49340.1 hypothetical protein [Caenimonas koreensis DSM 17982]